MDRATVLGCLEAIEAACTDLEQCGFDGFTAEELVTVLQRRETVAWRAPVIDHRILARLVADGNPGELGATTLAGVLAERLRIGLGAARQRVKEAADLGPRVSVTGAPLEPVLPNLATAQAAGRIGPEHVEIARKAYAKIPAAVDAAARERAERDLAQMGGQFGPQAFQKLADHLVAVLDPDGDFADRDRQARRGLRMSRQRADGMSTISATITPELRATLEPLFAKLAAPGMCNAADEHPCISGTPTEAQILNDDRTVAQRHHDALQALGRAVLASGDLGQLNGLPVTVIVTTTLAELHAAAGLPEPAAPEPEPEPADPGKVDPDSEPEAAAEPQAEAPPETPSEPQPAPTPDPKPLTGKAITAGGTLLPMADLIRMASHAYHYLSIFDGQGRPLWLGRTKRLASADQRIVLHARDRGCTRPGCTVSGYHTQVHHLAEWTRHSGATEINNLALACPADNRMATDQNWNTEINTHGRVEWIPPPELQHGQPTTNPYHFIEDLIDYYRTPAGTDPDPPDKPDDSADLRPGDRPPDDDLYPWDHPPLPGEPGYDEAAAEFAADTSWYLVDEGAEAQF